MILALYEPGVGDIVSINDRWLIVSDALPALSEIKWRRAGSRAPSRPRAD
jgi:hypothetical protein